jgi:hypothetical protein
MERKFEGLVRAGERNKAGKMRAGQTIRNLDDSNLNRKRAISQKPIIFQHE